MVIIASFNDYITALKAPTIFPTAKLEFLDAYEQPLFEIEDDFIVNGQITANFQDGVRRTATIVLDNSRRMYSVDVNHIWLGQQVRVWAGLKLPNGERYLLPQGVFYITNPVDSIQPNVKTIQLNLIDKWAGVDGTYGGSLDGIYQINEGDTLFNAIVQVLAIPRGNGHPLDYTPPVLDTKYLYMMSSVPDAYGNVREVSFLEAPYTIRFDAEKTYADVLLGINTMLVSTCGYDNMGYLTFRSANTQISDAAKPIAWEFSVLEREFYGGSITYDINSMCNDVSILGASVNGVVVSSRATNRNPASDCSIDRVGYHTYTEVQSKYYTYEQCNNLARYRLRQKTLVQKQISFTSTPIYHLAEDMLVSLLRPEVSNIPELYVVTGFSLPIGGTGPMTINAVSVADLDIYDKWDATYDLTVLCSQTGALMYEYADNQIVELANPYDILNIPEDSLVTFTVNQAVTSPNFAYRISSALLNGVALDHDGETCSFNMPSYNSQIVFVLTATSGSDLNYSYTGACSESTETDGDRSWTLIKFTSSGVLTLDSDQIDNGITADIWARGGAGGSNDLAVGSNGYDDSEIAAQLNSTSVTITVGTGGVYGASRGRVGGTSSWGTLVQAAGGIGAGGITTSQGGSLPDLFGSIEDKVDGASGAISSNGHDGAVWLRIAN